MRRWTPHSIMEAISSLVLVDALLAQKARERVRDTLVLNRRTTAE